MFRNVDLLQHWLDGRKFSTNWWSSGLFRPHFPHLSSHPINYRGTAVARSRSSSFLPLSKHSLVEIYRTLAISTTASHHSFASLLSFINRMLLLLVITTTSAATIATVAGKQEYQSNPGCYVLCIEGLILSVD